MSVQILGGRAGRVLPKVLAAICGAYERGIPCLLLVPEQYTLQAELELVRMLDAPGFFDIQVLSPSRLTRRVFELAGEEGRTQLDEKGRRMALSLCLTQCRETLSFYRSAAEKRGMAQKLSALIADLKRGSLTPEEYGKYLETLPPGASRMKQEDLLTLWQAYEGHMAGRFADGEDVQRAMLLKLPQTGLLRDAAVFVYGFDVLPQHLVELLCLAALESREVLVTMTMDRSSARDGEIFAPMRKSAARLKKALAEKGLPADWTYLPETPLAAAPALRHLEQNLYAYPACRFSGKPEGLLIHCAPTPYDEAVFAAGELRRLHEAGIPWGEMGIVLAARENYESLLPMVMESFQIPFYLSGKTSAAAHPLLRCVLGALRAVAKGFPQGEMIALAKSPFSPLTQEEGFQLENYALENGIHLYKWVNPFTRGEWEAIEPLRQRLMAPLIALKTGLTQAQTAQESLTAVFRLAQALDAYEKLMTQEQALLARKMFEQAAQTRQVWRQFLGTLEQMNALMEGSRVPLGRLPQWLEAGLSEMELSGLPPVPQTVQAGPLGHLMPGRLQVLFILGLQDGATAADQDSLLTDGEREAAQAATGRVLGSTAQELGQLAKSDLYRACALPTARLYLTYAQSSADGQTLRPSAAVTQLRGRVFPELVITGGAAWSSQEAGLWAPEAAAQRLGPLMRGGGKTPLAKPWREAFKWLWQSPAYHLRARQLMEGLSARVEASPLEAATAQRLFIQERTSISRLEEFAQCPFKHFVSYGLSPVSRREYAFMPDERGSFFHQALMAYVRKAALDEAWPQVDRAGSDALMEAVLPPLTAPWGQGPLGENRAAQALSRRYVQIVKRAAWMVTRHAQNSSFRTLGTEVAFGMEGGLPPIILNLPDGRRAALRGIIDRIDRYEGDEGVYLRVVDYKSSVHQLEPVKLWYGLQLQLILYLKAALRLQPGGLPSGAFYFTVKDPLVTTSEDLKEAAEREIAKELKLKGVVLADVRIVRAMDGEEGLSLGAVLKKNGEPQKGAAVLSLTQMTALMNHAQQTAQALWGQIGQGRIDIRPAVIRQWQACQQCGYRGICRFDQRLPGAQANELAPMDLEELQKRLDEG